MMPESRTIAQTDISGKPAGVDTVPPKPAWKRYLPLLKLIIVLLLLALLWRHIDSLMEQWRSQSANGQGLVQNWTWVVVSGAVYFASQVCFAAYWRQLLIDVGAPARPLEILRAYCVGTLAKYIPGKAGVVIVRTGMVQPPAAGRATVALSAFHETLGSMAWGSLIGGCCILAAAPDRWWVAGLGFVAAPILAAALDRRVLGRLTQVIARRFGQSIPELAWAAWRSRLWRGSPWQLAGWSLCGLSFWAAALAVGVPGLHVPDFLYFTGAAALATTLGFLFLVAPSGLAVRELVIIYVLAPRFGEGRMVTAAILLRLVWTVGELLLAGCTSLLGLGLLRENGSRATATS